MGALLGEMRAARGRRMWSGVLGVSCALAALGGCQAGDDEPIADAPIGSTTTAAATLAPCAEDRHMVAVDLLGVLMVGGAEVLGPWITDGVPPEPRAGAVELLQAYRERGYEVLYMSTAPPDLFPGQRIEDVVTLWLQTNGFPTGAGTEVWNWNETRADTEQSWVAVTDELIRLAGEGVSIDFGYTDNADKSYAFATGGIAAEHNFSLTPQPGGEGSPTSAPTTLIPNDDLVAQAEAVRQLAPVCQIG